MAEPGPFPPPSGALPPVPAVPVPPAPVLPAPVLPAPTGLPVGGPTFPAVPPPPPRRPWLIPVILLGSLAAVALIAVVAFIAIQLATSVSRIPSSEPDSAPDSAPVGELDDLLEGDPGSPIAVDPLDCVACFGIHEARTLTLPDEAYAEVGLPKSDGEVYEITAGDDQIDQTKWWKADGGSPDTCYFAYSTSPLFFAPGAPGDPAAEDDPVYYPEWHYDTSDYYYFSEGIRVFDDTDTASAYLAQLESAIAGCPDYSFSESGWSTVLTAAPAIDLPDSVAAYGWAESGGLNRYYGIDLQRGNLVVRLSLLSDPGGPTEAEFRQLAEAYAVLLAELEPSG